MWILTVDNKGRGVVDVARGVGDRAGVVPAVLQGQVGNGDRAAEVINTDDFCVGCIPEIIEGRVSPV